MEISIGTAPSLATLLGIHDKRVFIILEHLNIFHAFFGHNSRDIDFLATRSEGGLSGKWIKRPVCLEHTFGDLRQTYGKNEGRGTRVFCLLRVVTDNFRCRRYRCYARDIASISPRMSAPVSNLTSNGWILNGGALNLRLRPSLNLLAMTL